MTAAANRIKGPQRSPSRLGDTVIVGRGFAPASSRDESAVITSKVFKGPQTGHASGESDFRASDLSKVPTIQDVAVIDPSMKVGDSVDNVTCPPLGTFDPIECGHRSPKVPNDAVTTVTTLSLLSGDSVSPLRWGPLSAFSGARTGQRSPKFRAYRLGDLCPDSDPPIAGRSGHSIMVCESTLSTLSLNLGRPRVAVTLSRPAKSGITDTYYLSVTSFCAGQSLCLCTGIHGTPALSDRVTASLGTFGHLWAVSPLQVRSSHSAFGQK